ncbi:MAG TPA: RNA methyltransferase [Cyclobacteriaceae bacterium]|jgi:tRNA (guanosine-2'-O-)-methyltransferase|nr:RNA methyltransferase [Cyclobacteriaceae bacterium]
MTSKDQLIISHFSQYVSDHKKDFIEKVLDGRTKYVTLVLEDIYQSQNASAVLRTCECLGLQDVHIIEDESKYSVNKRVLKGANKWLDLHRYKMKGFKNADICFRKLRDLGYMILVTDPSPDGISINDIALDQKVAVVMGNELHGTSDFALNHADQKVFIPMHGFTESLNISVSAAIILNTLLTKLRVSNIDWKLSETEKTEIRLRWLRKIIRRSDLIEAQFLKTIE